MRKRYVHSVSIPIFAISLFLIAIFIASCGDEGDITEYSTGMTDVLQPATTPPTVQTPVPSRGAGGVLSSQSLKSLLFQICRKLPSKTIFSLYSRNDAPFQDATPHPGVAGLNLSKYDTFKKGGNGGPVFVAGNGNGSLVVKRIDGGGMPPIPPPLNADQVQLFVDWIDEGAENN